MPLDIRGSQGIAQGAPMINPATGTLLPDAVGSGTRTGALYLRDDGTWAALPTTPPIAAQYLVLALDSTLTAERRLVASGGLQIADGGANADATLAIVDGGITDAKLRDSAALSVIGRASNSAGDPGDIAAALDHQVLRRSGTSLAFGAVNLAEAAAVTGALTIANGGTGQTAKAAAFDALAPGTTKGDLIVYDNSGDHVRLAVGLNGQSLVAASSVDPGARWEDRNLVHRAHRILRGALEETETSAAPTGAQAYFMYVGLTTRACTPKHVAVRVTGLGIGTQVAGCGFFSTPSPPNKGGQTVTKIVASMSMDSMIASNGVKRNTSAFTTEIAAGTHLWMGFMVDFGAGTLPNFRQSLGDWAQGNFLVTASATAFDSASTWTGALPAVANQCVAMRGELD